MPVLKIQTNTQVTASTRANLLDNASSKVASILGKPEKYVMVMIEPNPDMLFGGSKDPLAYLELKSIGLPGDRTSELSDSLSQLINQQLDIPPERIYIEFASAERHMWGWSGGTF